MADRPGDGRRRPGAAPRPSGTAPSSCSTRGRRARSTRCPRSSTASGRPGRRSSASTTLERLRRVKDVVLAVDGGNSKTDVALCTVHGELLAAVRGPTTSHQAVGLEPGLDRLSGLLGRVLAEAGLGRGRPASAGRRARGVLPGGDGPPVRRASPRGGVPGPEAGRGDPAVQRHVRRPSGRDGRWLGGRGDLGSGMNAVGRAPDGRVARFSGLGDIAGDRGGGIRARDVGPWGGRQGGRRPRPGDDPLDARARPLRLGAPDDVTEAFYLGNIEGRAGRGAGSGRRPGRTRRRRGGDPAWSTTSPTSCGVRDGLDPAAQPRRGAGPGHARRRARPRRRRPAGAARDRTRPGRRAVRRGQRAPCAARARRRAAGARPARARRPRGGGPAPSGDRGLGRQQRATASG